MQIVREFCAGTRIIIVINNIIISEWFEWNVETLLRSDPIKCWTSARKTEHSICIFSVNAFGSVSDSFEKQNSRLPRTCIYSFSCSDENPVSNQNNRDNGNKIAFYFYWFNERLNIFFNEERKKNSNRIHNRKVKKK